MWRSLSFALKIVATPLWAKCEDETHTDLESFGTLENSELECKGQNTSHRDVFYINGKVLKCKCQKWPRVIHLDICSPSYGQKKGRESNCQFDSRPLKVKNWPLPDVYKRIATWHWKNLEESYNFGLDLIPIGGWSQEIWVPKVPGVQPGTVSGFLLGSPGKKCHSDVAPAEQHKEYYMGKVLASPEFGPWWVKWVQGRPWLVPTPKRCRMSSNQLMLVLDAWSCNNMIVPLPSLISGLLARPSYPL